MPMIEPRTVPQVKVDFMNQDHHDAVDLLNRIDEALTASDQQQIDCYLDAFLKHNEEHFAREEEQMRKVSFPPYACHKGEHDRVLDELRGVIRQWQQTSDTDALQQYLQMTLKEWFINHVSTMDSVTAHFINAHNP